MGGFQEILEEESCSYTWLFLGLLTLDSLCRRQSSCLVKDDDDDDDDDDVCKAISEAALVLRSFASHGMTLNLEKTVALFIVKGRLSSGLPLAAAICHFCQGDKTS